MIINLISFLSGFLFSSILDTTLGEFQEWAIVGAALIVSTIENLSKFLYSIDFKTQLRKSNKNYPIIKVLDIMQFFKIGIIYGLIVDAFKLGS
tara:strand:+ start:18360 stop:18638 length:279 start_codon:yes stop_codon:yes gene_type:complete